MSRTPSPSSCAPTTRCESRGAGTQPRGSGELLEDELPDPLGVCLTPHGLHDLTNEGTGRLDLATTDLLGNLRVGSDDVVNSSTKGGVVGDDGETASVDHLLRISLASDDTVDDLTGQLVGEGAVVNELLQLGDLGRGHTDLGQVRPGLVGTTGQLGEPPLARGSGLAASVDGLLKEVEGAGIDDRSHLQLGELPLGGQTSSLGSWKLRQASTQLLYPSPGRRDRNQVRLGEVAVVLGVGLVASGDGVFAALLPHPGLLTNLASSAITNP